MRLRDALRQEKMDKVLELFDGEEPSVIAYNLSIVLCVVAGAEAPGLVADVAKVYGAFEAQDNNRRTK